MLASLGGRAALFLCAALGGGSRVNSRALQLCVWTNGVVLHTIAVLVLHLSYQQLVWSMRGYSCTAGVSFMFAGAWMYVNLFMSSLVNGASVSWSIRLLIRGSPRNLLHLAIVSPGSGIVKRWLRSMDSPATCQVGGSVVFCCERVN